MIRFWKNEKKGGEAQTTKKKDDRLPALIREEAEKRRSQRLPFELQWRLNANFLIGNQHCDINARRMSVENYQPMYDYMSNEVFNRIAPIMETRAAHLLSQDYTLCVLPDSDRCEDRNNARRATGLLQERLHQSDFTAAFKRMAGLCEQTGSAFCMTWWDDARGDVDLTVLSPYEVLPEDLYVDELDRQDSLIIEQIKKVGQVEALYGVALKPEKVHSYGISQVAGSGGPGWQGSTPGVVPSEQTGCVILRTYMEKPSAAYPRGRLLVCAGDALLFEGELPGGRYPLCQFKSKQVPGQFFGRSVIELLIPLQRSYNGIKNRINDYVNQCAVGQLLIEDGSVDADDLCTTGLVPGEPVIYRRGAHLPELLKQPEMPEMAERQLKQMMQDMEYVAGVSGLMTDLSLPSGVMSGRALESLRDLDAVRLGAYVKNLLDGLITLGERILALKTGHDERFSDLSSCGRVAAQSREGGGELDWESAENCLKMLSGEQPRESAVDRYRSAAILRKTACGKALPPTFEERQADNADKENELFENGGTICVQPGDDDELHLYVHRLYTLGATFRGILGEDPARAQAMLDHIKEHDRHAKGEKE